MKLNTCINTERGSKPCVACPKSNECTQLRNFLITKIASQLVYVILSDWKLGLRHFPCKVDSGFCFWVLNHRRGTPMRHTMSTTYLIGNCSSYLFLELRI